MAQQNNSGRMQTSIKLVPWKRSCRDHLLLAETLIILDPSWAAIALSLPDKQASIGEHIAGIGVCSAYARKQ